MVKCYFIMNNDDECPFPPTIMEPPAVGTSLHIAGEKGRWEVLDVQYQFCRSGENKRDTVLQW